ncbi:embryogenesis-associated protein EMB8-like [Cucurbita maxima]|uniref:Embryogenesis-associated protein EMB8-like n=1 Tax=Cucurbita maxima TaxID=3661 RepID=A0A6J1HTF9_CUCMA|nr:embryogenesis-associated protein EMB8-like [Cucurbita maxima]
MDSSVSDTSNAVSPYQILFTSLSLIPLSHLLSALFIVFFIFLYKFFEIHFLHDFFHAFAGDRVSIVASDADFYQSVVSKCRILHGRFSSTPWLCSPHLQTIFLSIVGKCPPVSYKRQLFRVPDGGTIALDWLRGSDVKCDGYDVNVSTSDNEKIPTVIVIPGLTSDSTAAYIKHLAFRIAKRGWNVVVSNHRGLGGISLTSERVYNAAWTEDIRRVVGHIHSQHPEVPLFVVGTSIGANVLVKYLGEDGANVPISGAAAICSPWDLLICDRFINRRLVQGFYNKALADGLQGFALLHQSNLSRLTEWESIKKSRSVRDFDNYATRILANFETVDAYYRHASSSTYVGNVAVPLLCISALDDPLCTKEAIPWDECRTNRNVVLATTPHGGHLAFYEGITASSMWWARAVDEFLGVLHSSPYISVIKQMQKTRAPTPSFSIDQGPYVSVLEDGMVTAVGDEPTDDTVQDMPNQETTNVSTDDEVILDKEEADHDRKNDQLEIYEEKNTTPATTPVRKCTDCLARWSGRSVWLLAYIAVLTTWPMVRPALSLFFKKRDKNPATGGSRKR